MSAYGRWLTWLQHLHPASLSLPLADRATPEAAAAYISDLEHLNASSTVWGRITFLTLGVSAMAPTPTGRGYPGLLYG